MKQNLFFIRPDSQFNKWVTGLLSLTSLLVSISLPRSRASYSVCVYHVIDDECETPLCLLDADVNDESCTTFCCADCSLHVMEPCLRYKSFLLLWFQFDVSLLVAEGQSSCSMSVVF